MISASTITLNHFKVVSKERFLKVNFFYFIMKTKELFEDFIKALKEAGEKIKEEDPNYLLVTLNGGLPLYDALTIIDRDIEKDPNKVFYFPTSSKIKDSGKIVRNCFENFLIDKFNESDKIRKIVSLDEVLGGGSVCRLLNGYHYASRQMAKRNLKELNQKIEQTDIDNEAEKIRKRMPYKIIGLKESRSSVKISHEYKNHVKEGTIKEIPIKKIITLDDPDVQIIEWDHPGSTGWSGGNYRPRVKEFIIKESYLNFLRSVAAYVGVDPERVGPQNLEKIRSDCLKYSKKPPKF